MPHAVNHSYPCASYAGVDRTRDTAGPTGAVANHDHSIDAEQGSTHGPWHVGCLPEVIGDFAEFVDRQMSRQSLFHVAGEGGAQSLGEFHYYVAHESVTNYDVDSVGEKVHPLHVADEVEVTFFQELVALVDLTVSLGGLGTDAEQSYPGVFDPQVFVGEDRPQGADAHHQGRTAIDVAAHVH